ncbi:MAG: 4Fe-4S ferredoxin [Thermodesulfobacteriota bacterium]|nr:4Fe-4S ferredoxin [Thermodesulfobacteriota bacterium]
MENIDKKLREEAKRLLEEKKVDVLVGYETGTLPLTATPCFITNPEDAEKLVWNAFCTQNLAKFVHDLISQHRESQKRVKPEDRKKKIVGVVARGCTTRSIVLHLQERQYGRDEVVIIGVPCTGYVDGKRLSVLAGGEDIREGSLEGDQLIVKTTAGEKRIPLQDALAGNCLTCRFNNPVLSDLMIGAQAPPMKPEQEYTEIEAFENLPTAERWAYFTKEMNKCIRCYACRQACPSCYCKTCFVEQSQPQWVGLGEDATDTQVFQLMRLFHMVGRCVDCGSCVSVCPMGVDLRKFLKKIDKDVFELFENRAGSSLEDTPPLSIFKEHDKEDFIFNP